MKKLQYKGQSPALVFNAPAGLQGVIPGAHAAVNGKYPFILAFAKGRQEVESMAKSLAGAIEPGGYLWVCYPKGTSKKYKSDINRDRLMEFFGPFGLEPVTLVSIDGDWSAMRFKPVDEIKTMTRKWATSVKGKERIKDNK